ncbi:hypothetical protein GCM10007205_12430 [Oxalicibacterium flavum]|uniref:Uncharacterized protein n=1 Tax=Oxalicibacterium flavum TaxID=179467 RepID=A0A8J2UM04_9BURK|nr:hypothetical protein [Oxalicibacterium flavum]GGC04714.1 hypothetical protein GCM10007205_12430 [Oxalicibacterium flavum]
MKISEEFKVKNANGETATLQNIVAGKTYLDYGYTTLPTGFVGYRIKDTNGTAEKQGDGSFKLNMNSAEFGLHPLRAEGDKGHQAGDNAIYTRV